jgi:ComF family protein
VPLHPLRLWWRRYNQSAEIARSLGTLTKTPVDLLALTRKRATPSQGAMPSAKARRRNMQGAFSVHADARVKDRRIVLIDDVMTTGATVEACSRALKRAGASQVSVLTLARVVRPLTVAV